MSFDKDTRNLLARTVATCRRLLTDDVTEQLRRVFGMHPDGTVLHLEKLTHLTAGQIASARALRELLDHYAAGVAGHPNQRQHTAYERMALEIAFTALNRLAALRLCEERGLVVECVRKGTASDGFRVFERVSGGALGTRHETYNVFLECVFDELALDLPVLFDCSTPLSALFPSERCLESVLAELNRPELAHLWKEDETIGWIYQYFNPPEERKAMRDASQAPRNSRELAVRNQFFTPRYVVEFLVDNTLGRIWYEMRKGDTSLKNNSRYLVRWPKEVFLAPGEKAPDKRRNGEELSQEEQLKQQVYIEYRPKKDPRDLRVLDPACGSGHFLLYAFDLFEMIYREAWHDQNSPPCQVTGRTLREDYETLHELNCRMPELILRWNLHGIDIDSRAVQIAALALWLRAQRAWQAQGLRAPERPSITKSNIVTAEPMPGEADMLHEFTCDLDERQRDLVHRIFDAMKLAGEAGSLLKIEEEIQIAIRQVYGEHGDLFRESDEEQWRKAEDHLLTALRDYVERTDNRNAMRRRLFADDAAHGFAFVDLCRNRFDVVLMNPPFGNPSDGAVSYLKSRYPDYGGDILAAFLLRATEMGARPAVGAITSRAPFYLPSFMHWRRGVLFKSAHLRLFVDLGANVLDDALVEAVCLVTGHMPTEVVPSVRLNRQTPDSKGQALLEAITGISRAALHTDTFLPTEDDLLGVPATPIVYSAAHQLRRALEEGTKISPALAAVQQGLSTKDDFRYLRLKFEVAPRDIGKSRWGYIAKGGEYQPYYGDVHLVVKAHDNFREIAADLVAKYPYLKGDPAWVLHPEARYFVGGLTYPERTTSSFSPRVLPQDCYFSHVGLGIISGSDEKDLELLGWLVSRPVQLQIELQVGSADAVESGSAARHYSKTLVETLSIPKFGSLRPLIKEIERTVTTLRWLDEGDETTSCFVSPWAGGSLGDSIASTAQDLYDKREEHALRALVFHHAVETTAEGVFGGLDDELLREEVRPRVTSLPRKRAEDEIVERAFRSTIDDLVDWAVSELGAHRSLSKKAYVADRRLEVTSYLCGAHPESVAEVRRRLKAYPGNLVGEFAARLLSYSVGTVFGRWDVRIALQPELAPKLAGPFKPLPVCAPGSLIKRDGLPAEPGKIVSEKWLRTRPDAVSSPIDKDVDRMITEDEYPLRISWDGVLVDDPGWAGGAPHEDDLVRRVREVLDLLWGHQALEIEQEASEIFGVDDLRDYFRKPSGFFQDHLRRYSKSRRKAPIFWPLSTASGSYTVWVYYHRLTDQTLYTIVNKYLDPKIAEVERGVHRVEQDSAAVTGCDATLLRDRLNQGRTFMGELQQLRENLLRIAGLPYKPDLNDGVIINAAPFYNLFSLRSWAKETADCWEKLEKGEYDWAHLALMIWPERVQKACRMNRSIAIAHGLEHLSEAEPARTRSGRKRKEAAG